MGDVSIDIDFPKSIFVDSGKELIDDDNISSDKTWSSQKISEFISDVPLSNEYSNDYISFERTLMAEESELIIDDDRITINSSLKIYTNKPNVVVKKVYLNDGAIKIVFVPQSTDVEIKVLLACWYATEKSNVVSETNLTENKVSAYPLLIELYIADNITTERIELSGNVTATVKK